MNKKRQNAFHNVPSELRTHFVLNLYCIILHLIVYLLRLNDLGGDSLGKVFEKYPFLVGYFEQMYDYLPDEITWDEALDWWQRELEAWEKESTVHLPFSAIQEQLSITFDQRMVLMCVGLVEEDSRFGSLFSELQEPLSGRRPCLELISHLVLAGDGAEQRDPWQLFMPLLNAGLLETVNPDLPRTEWILQLPAVLWDVMRGEPDSKLAPWIAYYSRNSFPEVNELILTANTYDQLHKLPEVLDSGMVRVVVLRGMEGSERLDIMGAVAKASGKNVIAVSGIDSNQLPQWGLVGALCAATNSMLVITCNMGPGETAEIQSLGAYKGPLGVILGFEGGLKGDLFESSVTFILPAPDRSQRFQHWKAVFDGYAVEDLAEISERFHIPGFYISKAGSMAIAYANLDSEKTITGEHVRRACRALNHQLLDTLASRLEAKGSWDNLIVNGVTSYRLQELEQRCKHRERMVEHLGEAFQLQPNWGVRVLFSGPSGTGKTLAAKILAARLSMDIYRVDLAAVINKYVGQTEKNLHQVLTRAEELDVILLLDEGDALLGKRTDVKSANDRYANLETNYLLQRFEYYQGIVLITSNASENIDRAFQRRMDMAISFMPPEAEERWQIWQLHLSLQHHIDAGLLEKIALQCSMTGGQIRNAVQHATLLAMSDNSGIVCDWHLRCSIESEYRKAGALSPLNDEHNDKYSGDDLEAFIGALSI